MCCVFLLSLISLKICKNFVTDCHQCAKPHLGNIGLHYIQPGNNTNSKTAVKIIYTWGKRWYVSRAGFAVRLQKRTGATWRKDEEKTEVDFPLSGFCRFLSLAWSYPGITLQELPSGWPGIDGKQGNDQDVEWMTLTAWVTTKRYKSDTLRVEPL